MSGPSKVIVLDPDPRAGRQVQLGFEREGRAALVPAIPAEAARARPRWRRRRRSCSSAAPTASALELRPPRADAARRAQAPTCRSCSPAAARRVATLEAAGADEVVAQPVYLRDIVTIGRLLRGIPRGQRDHLVGSLVETTGVLTLVRALSALGRSAVLTLIRGLRRGEVRFFHGEVTSAQVGLIHGQAALHQLLLWTDARFDFAHEDIVRRQQIPLSPRRAVRRRRALPRRRARARAASCRRRRCSSRTSSASTSLGKQIPTEVHGVLRMFDGHRVLADILEDSPYRVFETLRVAQKAVEAGLLRPSSTAAPEGDVARRARDRRVARRQRDARSRASSAPRASTVAR